MRSIIPAAGAVLWRPATGVGGPVGGSAGGSANGSVEVALVHRPRYDDWSLPKGKLDRGETVPAAAAREVAEETGFRAVLGRHVGQVTYPLGSATKQVDYFAARALDGRFSPEPDEEGDVEVDELRWLPPGEARAVLSHPHDRGVLDRFTRLPHDTRTLLLVRHAKAGKREDWRGPDELRPLSTAGLRQTAALRALLPLFGADRVHSASPVRCTETVRELAEDLGTAIVAEPLLSEEGYAADPRRGLARLREIAAEDGTPVVCSQGGVIPDLLTALAEQGEVDLGRVSSKKGSVWVLSFVHPGQDTRLAAADYLPSPLPKP